MKKIFFILTAILLPFSSAHATSLLCTNRSQNFVLKQKTDSLYLVYDCNKSVTQCAQPVVFEALGFEEEGSFKLYGYLGNGKRTSFSLIQSRNGWTASLIAGPHSSLQSVLNCTTYKK